MVKAWLGATKARLRALAHATRMAPGSLQELDSAAIGDRAYLLRLRDKHGAILKAWLDGKVTTCIFGIPLGRRFLIENDAKITAATTDFTPLFPHGVLRQMNGGTHSEYRRHFIEAFKTVDLALHREAVVAIVDGLLDELLARPQPVALEELQASIKSALTKIMFRLILSIDVSWPRYDEMLAIYGRYAPHGTFKTARPVHTEAFQQMRTLLLDRGAELDGKGAGYSSLMEHFQRSSKVDDTVIGNLLQMTEAGRFDLMGLWSWLIQMLGKEQTFLGRIASEVEPSRRADMSQAAVAEALRLEQSEVILRRAIDDIVFEGFFIPRHTIIRIAIWETHKDATTFPEPFLFKPDRFLAGTRAPEGYGPVGLDRHKCLGADWITRLSAVFVEELALRCSVSIVADGTPDRGVFHYEPNSGFKVALAKRKADAALA